MSVDITTNVGFGYMLTPNQYNKMREAAEAVDEWDDMEDMFRPVDCYDADSPVFLGYIFVTVDPGDYITIKEIIYPSDFNPDGFAYVMSEIFNTCGIDVKPGSKWENPKLYTFVRIH
jgi:hypothetical protein